MPNRILTPPELIQANEILDRLRAEIDDLAKGDEELLFAFRRKIAKELSYDERSKPMDRKKLKIAKHSKQNGLCAICQRALPPSYNVLDRLRAADGYTVENTRLICETCDRSVQASRGYA